MARIELDGYGFGRAGRNLDAMGRRATDAKPVFRQLHVWLSVDERERFARQPWKPLAASTRARKAREGKDPRIMRVSGDLEEALTRLTGARSVGGARRVARLSAFYGLTRAVPGRTVPSFYGVFQHTGTGRMPARPLIVLSRKTRLRFQRALSQHLTEG